MIINQRLLMILLVLITLMPIMKGEVIPASKITEELMSSRPLNYYDDIIIGDILIKKENITTIKSRINFTNSTFTGKIILSRCRFEDEVVFRSCCFEKETRLNNSEFKKIVDFTKSFFNSSLDLSNSFFADVSLFFNSNFNGPANFINCTFNCSLDFSNSKFNKVANFLQSDFIDDAYFTEAEFFTDMIFEGANFFSISRFDAILANNANFIGARFYRDSTFNNSQFKGDAMFLDAYFARTIFLSKTNYTKLYIEWKRINRLFFNPNDPESFKKLIDNFRQIGFYKDANSCYYEFQKELVLHQNLENLEDSIVFGLEILSWIFYGFGMKPLFPFFWSIFFVVIFGIFWKILTHDNKTSSIFEILIFILFFSFFPVVFSIESKDKLESSYVYAFELVFSTFMIFLYLTIYNSKSKNKINDEYYLIGKKYNILNAIVFSGKVFLSGSKLFISPPIVPYSSIASKSTLLAVFNLERLLGALFSILFFLILSSMVLKAN